MPMFTPEQRARLRSALLDRAATDSRISSAAITGSAADGCEDRWSDIDLAFAVLGSAELPELLADWTAHMYDQCLALHHLDVTFGAWLYRVFLLPGALQVDLAFVFAVDFRPLSPSFRLVFGEAHEPRFESPSRPAEIAGMAWLYALHARSCIARRKFWQAEYMVSGIRDHVLALACIRHGLPAVHGRGMDLLPPEVAGQVEGALVRHLDPGELLRAFRVAVTALLGEITAVDPELAERLRETLVMMTET
jgi:hypothetical protein